MLHITNHDLNSWDGSEFERLGDATEAFLVLSTVIKGMPLVYSGQEAGNAKRLDFFERDPIQWKDHKFRGLYTTLLNFKKQNKALWNGTSGGELVRIKTANDQAIFAFSRSKDNDEVVGIFNLTDKKQTFSSAEQGSFTDLFSGAPVSLGKQTRIELKPWDYRVLVK
jgi:hypothetical protein